MKGDGEMTSCAIEIKNITKVYSDFSMKDFNLSINEGEIVGLIGANGAGKSTMIKSMLDMIPIDDGEVLYFGKDIKRYGDEIKQYIGYVGSNGNFYNDVKLKSIYKFVKDSYSTSWDDEYFHELVDNVFKLNLNFKFKELSKGMLVKYLIALALSHKPKVLILDEPTSGLDPLVREDVIKILYKMNKENKITILMSSHILEDIESICHRIVYIDNGKVVLDTKKDVVMSKYKKINEDFLDNESKLVFSKFAIISNDSYLFDIDEYNKYIPDKKRYDCNIENSSLGDIMLFLKEKRGA